MSPSEYQAASRLTPSFHLSVAAVKTALRSMTMRWSLLSAWPP